MKKERAFEMKAINTSEWNEFVEESINDWRNYANKVIEAVENSEMKQIKLLVYFSLMDCIAQDLENYPKGGQQNTFTKFILKYQKGYDFLELVDPITLYYHFEEKLTPYVNLEELEEATCYDVNDTPIRSLADKMSVLLDDDKLKKHRYVDLLYRIRCMISHEFSDSYTVKHEIYDNPFYINCGRCYTTENNNVVEDDVWQLRFPIKFIKELCINCINN